MQETNDNIMSNYSSNNVNQRNHYSTSRIKREGFDLAYTNETKNKNVEGSFDFSLWVQQGALCSNSCYNQISHENRHTRTASISSNTYSTEDNSSLNDSFDDPNDDAEENLHMDSISWPQQIQGMFLFYYKYFGRY